MRAQENKRGFKDSQKIQDDPQKEGRAFRRAKIYFKKEIFSIFKPSLRSNWLISVLLNRIFSENFPAKLYKLNAIYIVSV